MSCRSPVLCIRPATPGLLATLALLTGVVGAGDLDPPGAPAPTTSSLGDARTPIVEVPMTIDTPGSFYLTGRLTLATLNTTAITIAADEVTIDFNGFALIGPGSGSGSSGHGVFSSESDNIAILNGTIRDFAGAGVRLNTNRNGRVERMQIFDNGLEGVSTSTNSIIADNLIRENGGDGINVGLGSVVRNNSVRQNGGDGIDTLGDTTITGNTCWDNGLYGVRAVDSLIMGNACTDNDSGNISATTSTLANNHAP